MVEGKLTYEELEQKICELEKKAKFFELISENSTVWETYRDISGKIIYSNNSFESIAGYKKEELLNGLISDKNYIHPEDYERFNDEIQQSKNHTAESDFKFRMIAKGGSIKLASLHTQSIYNENEWVGTRTSIFNIADNINFDKSIIAKEKEIISSNLLQIIADNIPAYIAVVDINTLIYKFANKRYTQSFNKKIEEVIGAHISEIIGKPNTDFALKHIDEVRNGRPSSYINTFNLVEGIRFIHVNFVPGFNQSGEVTDIIVLSYDISATKKVEKELQESKEKYAKIFDRAPVLISISDINTGIYLDVNSYALEFSGYSREEVIGHKSIEIGWITAENRALLVDSLNKTGKIDGLEMEFKTKNNKSVYGLVNGEKIILDNIECLLTITTDITERKKFEFMLKEKNDEIESQNEEYKQINEELNIAKELAEESNKLKTSFLQNISHEIRTPMNAISGFSNLLNNPDLAPVKRKSFISIIKNSSDQLLSIVNDILTISSIETNQIIVSIENVCVNMIIIELLAIFKNQSLNQNVSIYSKQPLSDLQSEIFTDKTKLTQILSNLIGNALKFTLQGSIEFGYELVSRLELDSESSSAKEYLQFYVKDTGIGIEPKLTEKIFERFRQADLSTNKTYGGSGLGLSISKGFVELLGGNIWAESELGKGSTFYFTLPYDRVNKK